jgi:hypothetical protein
MKICFDNQSLILTDMKDPSYRCPSSCSANARFKGWRVCFYVPKKCNYATCYIYNSDLPDIFTL